jgi:hypothetical protein
VANNHLFRKIVLITPTSSALEAIIHRIPGYHRLETGSAVWCG